MSSEKKLSSEIMENSDEIRRKAIKYIKEKVNKNPGYLHPCNRERLEDMKRLGFICGKNFLSGCNRIE